MEIKENEPLKEYNTYRTGGVARYFAKPADVTELIDVLTWAISKQLPHEIIGYGANLLISERGYDGVIICLRDFEKWIVTNKNSVLAGGGVLLNEVVKHACDAGLAGMQNLAGIPGTVGGAVRMNAGAFGTEMKDIVVRANVLESVSEEHFELVQRMMNAAEICFGYRDAPGLLSKIVVAAEFFLVDGDMIKLDNIRKSILKKRLEKQPLNFPSCGSVFKRPLPDPETSEARYAGGLIEASGLKGARVGGAVVSPKHANFILNDGSATSSDIYELIQRIKYVVKETFGVFLEEEVKYLGNFKG